MVFLVVMYGCECWTVKKAECRRIDANRSEREVRPLATARKSSHGSQSDRGAETRGVFMSILHTLKACGADPETRLKSALDAYAEDPDTDMFKALFGERDLAIPKLPRKPLRKLPKSVTRAAV